MRNSTVPSHVMAARDSRWVDSCSYAPEACALSRVANSSSSKCFSRHCLPCVSGSSSPQGALLAASLLFPSSVTVPLNLCLPCCSTPLPWAFILVLSFSNTCRSSTVCHIGTSSPFYFPFAYCPGHFCFPCIFELMSSESCKCI